MEGRVLKNLLFVVLLVAVSGCVYKPHKIAFYDEDCDVVSRKYVLTKEELHLLMQNDECQDAECITLLLGRSLGIVFAGPISAVISGSFVVVGNTLYWLEKQMKCDG